MGSRCDMLNVEYLSDFVKGSALRKISAFAIGQLLYTIIRLLLTIHIFQYILS